LSKSEAIGNKKLPLTAFADNHRKWHTTTTAAEEILPPERCIALMWPVPNAAEGLQNSHLSRIRPDWTNCFAETATKSEVNLSEETTNQDELD